MKYPTKIIGNAALVKYRAVSSGPCQLVGFVGHNSHTDDLYIQVHAVPPGGVDSGDVPVFSVLATAGMPFSFALPAPVGLDALSVFSSTALDTYADVGSSLVTIQVLLAA